MRKVLLSVVHLLSCQVLLCLLALSGLLGGTAWAQSQAISVTSSGPVAPSGHDQEGPRLGVTIRTDKSSYNRADGITFEVLLTNSSSVPIYLYSFLARGESASLSLWAKDAVSGKDIPQVVIADSITPPPTSKDEFIRLLPHHVYGVLIRTSLANLNVQRKGTYEFVVEYHSPVPSNWSFGLPIWSKEMGAVSSNRVTITVGD
jgi:hypothetical protein